MLRYLEIKQNLLKMIAEMNPGDRFPSRTMLIRKLETTRTTLDKAISELQSESILLSEKGNGTFVASTLKGAMPEVENWGVMVPSMAESIYNGLIKGIESFVHKKGVNLVLCTSDNNKEMQEYNIDRLMSSIVRGFIIVPVISSSIEDNYHTYRKLISSKMPFVFCNRPVEGIDVPAVVSNDFYGGYIAAKHLIEKGYRHIAYIARLRHSTAINRFQGYASALQENGLSLQPELVCMDCGHSDEDVYTACKGILTCGKKVDAIFCFNDYIALQVYRCVRDMGLKISDDVGVIGYDNIEEGSALSPALTSIYYKNREIGHKAAEVLWNKLHAPDVRAPFEYYLFQPGIVDNCSCLGPKPCEALPDEPCPVSK